jgi:hypothetical protein
MANLQYYHLPAKFKKTLPVGFINLDNTIYLVTAN